MDYPELAAAETAVADLLSRKALSRRAAEDLCRTMRVVARIRRRVMDAAGPRARPPAAGYREVLLGSGR